MPRQGLALIPPQSLWGRRSTSTAFTHRALNPMNTEESPSPNNSELLVHDEAGVQLGRLQLGPKGLSYFRGRQRLPHLVLGPEALVGLMEQQISRTRAREMTLPPQSESQMMGVIAASLNMGQPFFRWTGLKTPALDHRELSKGELSLPPNRRRGGTYLHVSLHIRLAIWMIDAYVSGPLRQLPMTLCETEEAPVSKQMMRRLVLEWLDRLES